MQVPDKQCHCGIFFTNSDAFNTHLESDHKAEGKWPCNEEPTCQKLYNGKGTVWSHIRQKHRNIDSNQCLLCPFSHDEEYGILKYLSWPENQGILFFYISQTLQMNRISFMTSHSNAVL